MEINISILNLNARIGVVSIIIVLFDNLFSSNNWPIVDTTILTPSNYSESTIDNDIRNGLQATSFIFSQYIEFAACCSTDTRWSNPYNIRGSMCIIEGEITI